MDEPGMVALRPLPAVEEHTAPYWKAAAEGRLVLQRCASCEQVQFPPEISCTHCGAVETEWTPASGRARLYTWTLCHPPLLPYFGQHAPWAVAAVELEEGVRMTTQIVGMEPDEYAMDMPLEVDFERIDDGRALVVFRPTGKE